MRLKMGIIGVLMIIIFYSCQIFDNGKNELIKEYYNPKQSMKVVIFQKTGNATTNNSIQVSVQGYDYELMDDEVGNIFVADQIERANVSIDSLVLVNWIDNETLQLTYPKEIRTFKTEKKLDNNIGKVIIEYNK